MTDEIRPEDRLSPTRIRELLERATPGPWDGELPEDFTPTISEREANTELAAVLPDIVADWLRLNRAQTELRRLATIYDSIGFDKVIRILNGGFKMNKTLAEMAPDERAACVGLWADDGEKLVLIYAIKGDTAYVIHDVAQLKLGTRTLNIAPDPTLPRAWSPDGEAVGGRWEYIGRGRDKNNPYRPTLCRWTSHWEEME